MLKSKEKKQEWSLHINWSCSGLKNCYVFIQPPNTEHVDLITLFSFSEMITVIPIFLTFSKKDLQCKRIILQCLVCNKSCLLICGLLFCDLKPLISASGYKYEGCSKIFCLFGQPSYKPFAFDTSDCTIKHQWSKPTP